MYEKEEEELRRIQYSPVVLLVINSGARTRVDNSTIVLYGMTSVDEVSKSLCGAVC